MMFNLRLPKHFLLSSFFLLLTLIMLHNRNELTPSRTQEVVNVIEEHSAHSRNEKKLQFQKFEFIDEKDMTQKEL